MADKQMLTQYLSLLLFIFESVFCRDNVFEYPEDKKPCTYFEDKRYASLETGLVNCTWYVSNSCCKRTEVTSVFSSNMLPLYLASKDCHNRMNYLMCFFCSPDQHLWYKDGQAHVCESFCLSVYKACADAYSSGTRLGEVYKNGSAFCAAQNFKVVNSKYCFKYDPTVFDSSIHHLATVSILITMVMIGWLLK